MFLISEIRLKEETGTENPREAMSEQQTEFRVVIVGGGTAGWMTAAALSRYLPKHNTRITLVESEAIGTVGVGEATIPQIADFNRMLGINEDEFVRETAGTFKLGIEFANWGRLGDRYFHPFGDYGFDIEGTDFHHFWRRSAGIGDPHGLNDYSLNASAAYAGKFIRPDGDPRSVLGKLGYAFHFDASRYAAYLRRYSEARGTTRTEGKVTHVDQRADDGFIESITLEDGQVISGDLFVDCTGFRGVLIEGALQAGYEDWSGLLPMDRAVAMGCETTKPPKPYTIATARDAGWTWRIPLQHRIGNGHVYSSRFTDTETATQTLMDALDGGPIGEPRHLRFITGRRKEFWKANCVAIGLSAGFLEPLESTSIHLIQTGVAKLLSLFPNQSFNPVERDEYNRLLGTSYQHTRDFILLHYVATERDDTPFWKYMQDLELPTSLHRKMALMESSGSFFRYEDELFSVVSWLAVMQGQRRGPKGYNTVADGLSQSNLTQSLTNMRQVIDKTVTAMPTHQQFIDRFCRVPQSTNMETV